MTNHKILSEASNMGTVTDNKGLSWFCGIPLLVKVRLIALVFGAGYAQLKTELICVTYSTWKLGSELATHNLGRIRIWWHIPHESRVHCASKNSCPRCGLPTIYDGLDFGGIPHLKVGLITLQKMYALLPMVVKKFCLKNPVPTITF